VQTGPGAQHNTETNTDYLTCVLAQILFCNETVAKFQYLFNKNNRLLSNTFCIMPTFKKTTFNFWICEKITSNSLYNANGTIVIFLIVCFDGILTKKFSSN
jgi:hypothetical protein